MQPITELVSDEYISKIWDEKVKGIEKSLGPGRTLLGYFTLQVGPDGAKNIMNQMKSVFMSGYIEGFEKCQKYYTMT